MQAVLRLWGILVACCVGMMFAGCQNSAGQRKPSSASAEQSFAMLANAQLRLNCEQACSETWDVVRNYARQLFDDQNWRELALLVERVRFNSDQSYFYLGRSAEGLGHADAARTYYQLSQAATSKCANSARQCDGLDIQKEVESRTVLLEAFGRRNALLMRCLDTAGSYQYVRRTFTRIPEFGANDMDPTGLAVLISAAINDRYQGKLAAKDVALAVIAYTRGARGTNFLVVKRVVESLGYKAQVEQWGSRKRSAVLPAAMSITVDEHKVFTLLTEVNQDRAVLLYASGQVCVVPGTYFLNGPDNSVFLEILPRERVGQQ